MNNENRNSSALGKSFGNSNAGQFPGGHRLVWICLLLLLVVSIVVLAWVPPVSRDALTHHLIVPKLYLQHGSLHEIPSVAFSYYPMNLDLLYMIPLYFGNDIAPKLIHFLFALLTAGLIYRYLRRRIDQEWALAGALFFLSLPIIVKLSITVYVDLGLIFFSTAAILSLFEWNRNRFALKYLVLSGACCGLALGTKYNGLIALFILTASVPLMFISAARRKPDKQNTAGIKKSIQSQFKALGYGAIFFSVALLVFSPWMIRNYVWKGNPIYPLYNKVFNRPAAKTAAEQPDRQQPESALHFQRPAKAKSKHWGPFALRKIIYGESWWEIGLLPVRIFFQGRDDNPRYFDGKLSPFLFILPFFAFIGMKGQTSTLQTEKKMLAAFSILFVLFAFSQTSIRIRYVAPIIAPLVMLAVLGLNNIARKLAKHGQSWPGWVPPACIALLTAGLFAYNGVYIYQQFNYVKPFSYLSGKVNRDEYIAAYRPEYSIYQYANHSLPDDAKILGLFLGNRRYYSERELIFGINLFKKIVDNADSADRVLAGLHQRGFSYLIIRYDLFNNWTERQFNAREKEILKLFFSRDLKHLLSKDGYGLFELRDI